MNVKSLSFILGSVCLTVFAQVCMKWDSAKWASAASAPSPMNASSVGSPVVPAAAADAVHGAKIAAEPGFVLSLWQQFSSPLTLLAIAAYGLSTLFWLVAIRDVPLGTAYVFSGITISLVCLMSAVLFHEPFTPTKVAALVLTVVGVTLFARG